MIRSPRRPTRLHRRGTSARPLLAGIGSALALFGGRNARLWEPDDALALARDRELLHRDGFAAVWMVATDEVATPTS